MLIKHTQGLLSDNRHRSERTAAFLVSSALLGERGIELTAGGFVPEPVILLVEDEPLVLLVAQDALAAGGYVVAPATSGAEALDMLESQHEELAGIVTDIRLGAGPSGWDIAKRARELRADLPIVYATGDSAHEWPVHGVPSSAVVQKPYAGAQLLTAISSLITAADMNSAS